MSWTVVNHKKSKNGNKPSNISSGNDDSKRENTPTTPEELYESSVSKMKSNKSADIINNMISMMDDKKQGDYEKITNLGEIASFAIETMTSILEGVLNNVPKDNQQAVLSLTSCIDNIKEVCQRTSMATNMFEVQVDNINIMRAQKMDNIKLFLKKCGIETKTDSKEESASISPDITIEKRKTYASAIGATHSIYVVDIPPVKSVKLEEKSVNIGLTNVSITNVNEINDCTRQFSINYVKSYDVFMMRAGKNVYTLGPGNFVNLKLEQGRTSHAKRCENPYPCSYRECRYYHDPVTSHSNFNSSRNFALSYVAKLIDMVKTDKDIVENINSGCNKINKSDLSRDLAQIGGMLLMRAIKIMDLRK
jgi:hypothetical protein